MAAGGLGQDGGVAHHQVGALAEQALDPVVLGVDLLALVEHVGDVDRRLGDGEGQLEQHRHPALHVAGRPVPRGRRPRCGPARCRWPGRCRCGRRAPAAGPARGRCGPPGCRPPGRPSSHGTPASRASRSSVIGPSRCGSPTGCRPARRCSATRSVTGRGAHDAAGHAVLAEEALEVGLVVAGALGQVLDHQRAREAELAAGERAGPGGGDHHAPRRDDAAAELLAGLGVDHRDGVGQDERRRRARALARPAPPARPCTGCR